MSTFDGPPPPPPPDGPPPPPPPPPPDGPPPPPPEEPTAAYAPVGPPPAAVAPSTTPDWVKPVAIAAALALLIAIVVAVTGGGDSKKEAAGGSGEIFLQPISEPGPDPFGPDVSTPLPPDTIPPPTSPPSDGGSTSGPLTITAKSGATKGLYGGTKDQSRCDKQGMIDFLNQNPSKKAAWAGVQGISTSEVSSYIDALVPVVLQSDTRVTNHGFKNGRATAYQAILQTGTAVLVDNRGVPRARCACGNPLTPPIAVPTTPVYKGDPWTGFSPGNVTVINQSTTIINNITIIDIQTGSPITIVINNNGGSPGGSSSSSSSSSTTSTTRKPGTPSGGGTVFHLTNVEPKINHPDTWRADGNQGTAYGEFTDSGGNKSTVNYKWTVLQTIDPTGSRIDYSGTSTGSMFVQITSYDDGKFSLTPSDELARRAECYNPPNGCSKANGATITVPSSTQSFVLKISFNSEVSVLYTYSR